jgi:glyoxylase-like metal-dependent hydrolase (beta-lactamase superfamily II)
MNAMTAPIITPFPEAPASGEALEVADGVLWIRLPLPMALDHVNVYALDDGDGWTIVDTGFHSRKSVAIWRSVLEGPLGGRPINRVVVTHHHPDHIGNAGWFKSEMGCELVTTRTAWLFARMLTLDEQDRPTPETIAFWRGSGMDPALLETRMNQRPFNFADVVAPLPLGFARVKEGDRIVMGGRAWRVRIGNGHAPEHATFWSEDCSLLLGGDQLLATISPNIGVYATEPDADPVADWLESCTSLQPFAREDHLVLPGHKLPYTGLPTRMRQLIENHHSALERLSNFIETPRTAPECFSLLFKREISGGTYGLALVESVAHLNHLKAIGAAGRRRRTDGSWEWFRTEV